MAYTESYKRLMKGLEGEDLDRFLKADIPMFEVVGYQELTADDTRESLRIMREMHFELTARGRELIKLTEREIELREMLESENLSKEEQEKIRKELTEIDKKKADGK